MEKLKELFPKLIFTDKEVTWKGGEYVSGYRDGLALDGEFTSAQLRALADWMDHGTTIR